MRYTILLHYPEMRPEDLGEGGWEEGMAAFDAYAKTLHAAGVLLAFEVLQPSSATTTVRRDGDELRVQDGPFADTKDRLAGTIVVDVPDLDAALELAKQSPTVAWGPIEVRPGATHVVDGEWTPNA